MGGGREEQACILARDDGGCIRVSCSARCLRVAVRAACGSASHATIFDPPPAERPAHLGRLLHESEMRPVTEVTETRGEGRGGHR